MTTDAKNIQFLFQLQTIKTDTREFRQDSDSFTAYTPVYVEVLLPRDGEYVANLSEISLKELSGETAPAALLTPKGYAYLKKALEMGFDDPNLRTTLPESEEWGNTVDTEKMLEPSKSAPEEDWGKSPFEKESDKVVSETWDDKKEQW